MSTVAQISTPVGEGGISIIKVSGADSINIVNKIFKAKDLNKAESHKLNYGYIYDENLKIDEVLVSVMRAPHSYTGEDVVEVNCHGGIVLTNKILKLILHYGAELAPPGEFTKRAFLNGKKSTDDVTTIMDLISSKSEEALSLAINSLNNSTKELIEDLRQNLLDIITTIEINIDYPEYEDLPKVELEKFETSLDRLLTKIKVIIEDSKSGEILKNGIETLLLGQPNVGKSSLLNFLSKKEKAIVTEIAGTTRDILENEVMLGNITLNLVDTAGIRDNSLNLVEEIGIKKSLERVNKAELVLLVIDGSKEINDADIDLLNLVYNSSTRFLIIVNKSDDYFQDQTFMNIVKNIQNQVSFDLLNDKFIEFSTVKNIGYQALQERIEKLYNLKDFDAINSKYIANVEKIYKLETAQEKLLEVKEKINENYFIDLLSIDLKEILFILGDMLGIEVKSNYLDEMFSRFCVGK